MATRAYDLVRAIVQRQGGYMEYQRKGYRYGAWIIRSNGRTLVVEATGKRSFPTLDQLYRPKDVDRRPEQWDDYRNQLVEDAESRLLTMLR